MDKILEIKEDIIPTLSMFIDDGFKLEEDQSVPKDIDIIVRLLSLQQLTSILNKYGKVDLVGESFGVIKFKDFSGYEVEIALPRVDEIDPNKKGHTAIIAQSDPFIPIEKDLVRRDLTINSIAVSFDKTYIDPFNGIQDIENKLIRATSEESFVDDPLRMIRALQFSSRFGFTVEESTFDLIKNNSHLISTITPERILIEFQKVIDKKGDIKIFISLLFKSNLFKCFFGLNTKEIDFDTLQFSENTRLSEMLFIMFNNCLEDNMFSEISGYLSSFLKIDNKTESEIRAIQMIIRNEKNNNELDSHLLFRALQVCSTADEISILKDRFNSYNYPRSKTEIALTGQHILDFGFAGQLIGFIQKDLLDKILRNELRNDKDSLSEYVIEKYK